MLITNSIYPANVNITNNNYQISINGVPELFDSAKKALNQNYASFYNLLKANKLFLFGTSLSIIYLYTNYQIYLGKQVLYNPKNWTNWKSDTSFNDLINQPTNTLCRELHQSILDKYSNNNQSDCMLPIVLFHNDLNQELAWLRALINYFNKLNQIKLTKLVWLSQQELALAQEKINRLSYLKKIITESVRVSLNN